MKILLEMIYYWTYIKNGKNKGGIYLPPFSFMFLINVNLAS